MYTLMGVGLSLIFGILEIVNFAHGEFFMIGAYVMYYTMAVLGLPFPVGCIVAALFLFLFGVLVERSMIAPLRRSAGRDWLLDAFVLTIGLVILLQNAAQVLFGADRYGVSELISGGISWGDIAITYERLAIIGMAIVVCVLLWAFVKFTALGKAIRATAQNADAAQTLGIDIQRIFTISFGIGSALAGISGAMLISIFPAYPTVGEQPALKSFAVVILGGLGNIPGAIAGGLLLGIIESFTFFLTSAGWQSVLTAAVVVLVLIFRPQGLFVSKAARP